MIYGVRNRLLLKSILRVNKYRNQNRYLSHNQVYNETFSFDTNNEIKDPFYNGLNFEDTIEGDFRNQNSIYQAKPYDEISPSFDNNVLSNDPFGRLKNLHDNHRSSKSFKISTFKTSVPEWPEKIDSVSKNPMPLFQFKYVLFLIITYHNSQPTSNFSQFHKTSKFMTAASEYNQGLLSFTNQLDDHNMNQCNSILFDCDCKCVNITVDDTRQDKIHNEYKRIQDIIPRLDMNAVWNDEISNHQNTFDQEYHQQNSSVM